MSDEVDKSVKTARGVRLTRRELIGLGGAVVLAGGITAALRAWNRHERGLRAEVFIGRASGYRADLVDLIGNGLAAIGVKRREIRGKRILLKPNLVETARGQAHINTHPALVVAAAEVFRRLDAREVIVAEGQGHRRDSWLVLDESGMGSGLREANLTFVDLNHDEVVRVDNAAGHTKLTSLYLPKTLLGVDWVVSLPKTKTHHWVGVTCAMKNLFGVMPGIVYGWPKNVFHCAGISESVLDINAAVRPSLAIADGIVGMEGDGPIMGKPKEAGCLVIGCNLAAVDATCTRVMGLNPYGVKYLAAASGRFGPIHPWNITQRGESIDAVRTHFEVLDLPHLEHIDAG